MSEEKKIYQTNVMKFHAESKNKRVYETLDSMKLDGNLMPITNNNYNYDALKHMFTEEEQEEIKKVDLDACKNMLGQVADMVRTLENNWKLSKDTWKVNDEQIKLLYQYNEQHKKPMPENLTDEQKESWDQWNGLDHIPLEEITKIFGETHPVMHLGYSPIAAPLDDRRLQDRLKVITSDFFMWISSLKEYENIYNAYLRLIEYKEYLNLIELIKIMEKEEDKEKRETMKASIDLYFYRKYVDFLGEHIRKSEVKRLSNQWKDKKSIDYLIHRTKDKLKDLGISSKFILELSQFEKRFLDEKYHKQNNILLIYFMDLLVYSDTTDVKSEGRIKATCFVFAIDGIIRNTWESEVRKRILNNIIAFEDQFLDRIQ